MSKHYLKESSIPFRPAAVTKFSLLLNLARNSIGAITLSTRMLLVEFQSSSFSKLSLIPHPYALVRSATCLNTLKYVYSEVNPQSIALSFLRMKSLSCIEWPLISFIRLIVYRWKRRNGSWSVKNTIQIRSMYISNQVSMFICIYLAVVFNS